MACDEPRRKCRIADVLVDGREVRVTNPDRVLVDGVTKAAALRYFLAVGDGIVAALRVAR